MSGFWGFVGLSIVVVIVIMAVFISVGNAKAEKIKQRLRELDCADDTFISTWDSTFVGLGFGSRRIAIGRNESTNECKFEEIIQVDLVRNDDVATSTNKASLVSRALVGGVLLGGVGAIAGAVTAKTSSTQKLNRLVLRIITERGTFPVTFLDLKKADNAGLDSVRDLMTNEGDRFYGLVLRAMREAKRPQQAEAKNPQQSIVATIASRAAAAPSSTSAEIEKLWELKERGIISAEEFSLAKRKILPN